MVTLLLNFFFPQVTKLCDLGPNDGVCSVQWTREGSYIAIGTALGQVQVINLKTKLNPIFLTSPVLRKADQEFGCSHYRFGMELTAKRSEQWVAIKQEQVFWHGTRAH